MKATATAAAWIFDAALLERERPLLERLLTADERERARRLTRAEARLAYVVGRGVLRSLLARQIGCGPEEVPICYNRFGKPELPGGGGPFFNLSNASGRIAIALGPEAKVGIDIERVRDGEDWPELSRRFFAQREAGYLASLDPAERTAAFFHIWTRKEAYLKALGSGLSTPLDAFCVPPGPLGDQVARVEDGSQAWEVRAIDCGEQFAGACVVPAGTHLVQPSWPDDGTTGTAWWLHFFRVDDVEACRPAIEGHAGIALPAAR